MPDFPYQRPILTNPDGQRYYTLPNGTTVLMASPDAAPPPALTIPEIASQTMIGAPVVTAPMPPAPPPPVLATPEAAAPSAPAPALAVPAAPPAPTYPEGFGPAYDFTMGQERGFVQNDAGRGPSYDGLNQEANPDLNVSRLSEDERRRVYFDRYFKPVVGDVASPEAQMALFDTGVLMGQPTAQRLWQESGGDLGKFLDLGDARLREVAANPDNAQYLAGWLRRRNDLRNRIGQNNTGPLPGGLTERVVADLPAQELSQTFEAQPTTGFIPPGADVPALSAGNMMGQGPLSDAFMAPQQQAPQDWSLLAAGSALLSAPTLKEGIGAAGNAFVKAKTDAQTRLDNQRYRDVMIRKYEADANRPKITPLANGAFSLVQGPDGSSQVIGNSAVQSYLSKMQEEKTRRQIELITGKPLTGSVQDAIVETEGAARTAGNIVADLNALYGQLDQGAFSMSGQSRLRYAAEQATNNASPEAQAYANFWSKIQEMRNEMLRLNKGTQTEGDAIRAMDELISGMGQYDDATVKLRLKAITEKYQRVQSDRLRDLEIRQRLNGIDNGVLGSVPQSVPAIGSSVDDALSQY